MLSPHNLISDLDVKKIYIGLEPRCCGAHIVNVNSFYISDQRRLQMTSFTTNAPPSPGWLANAEAWLDARGKGAWIAAMVIGFIFFWPVGLALLAYMIWSKRMFSSCARKSRSHSYSSHRSMRHSSGNSAFDAYKADTLRRWNKNSRILKPSLAACATPKTRQSLTSSWTSGPSPLPPMRTKKSPRPKVPIGRVRCGPAFPTYFGQ